MITLAKMEKAGKRYLQLSIILMVIHLVAFVVLYLQLPPVIEYRDDLKPGTQTGPKHNIIWMELVFIVVCSMLLFSQRNKKEMKLNWPVNESNRENLYIAARWMTRRILFCVTILTTIIMLGSMLNAMGWLPAGVLHIVIPVFALLMIVVVFHSIMRMQDANAGRIEQ
jgi:hypothetical protein